MKLNKLFSIISPLVLMILLLTSCETKKTELVSESPDGKVHITVAGSKSFMEPWSLNIEIKGYEKSRKLETELYADEINNKNIIFNWQDNSSCIITFIAQDDTQRSIEIAI